MKFKFDNYTTELPFQPRTARNGTLKVHVFGGFLPRLFFFASCVGKYEVFHFIVLVNLLGWIEMPGFLLHSRFLDDVVGLTRMIGKGNGNIHSIFLGCAVYLRAYFVYILWLVCCLVGWLVGWLID